ncbi:MAG: cytidine deaminase [Thermomicrobiales bacterium]|nr:cytidine deaminase [Thermomicrobiales bacterium]
MCAKPNDDMVQTLMDAAVRAAEQAYVPYSNFPVGAALLANDGTVVTGCNVENASYPLTNCAERVAIGTAVAGGIRTIQAIAVYAPRVETVTPCGACRQVINEFKPEDDELWMIFSSIAGPMLVPFSELLPRAFGPRDLEDWGSGPPDWKAPQ